jgi:hypothetical protein
VSAGENQLMAELKDFRLIRIDLDQTRALGRTTARARSRDETSLSLRISPWLLKSMPLERAVEGYELMMGGAARFRLG